MAIERIDCSRQTRYGEGARPFPRAVRHPMFYTAEEIERARRRVARHDWAKRHRDGLETAIREHGILEMTDGAIREEIFERVNFPLPRCPADRQPRSWRVHFWEWMPEDPAHVRCRVCGGVFPGPEHEPVGQVEIVGPAGKAIPYRYWEDEEGVRYFFENMVLGYRQERIVEMAGPLSRAYALSGSTDYARKAAVILDRLAEVYPNYPVHGLGSTYNTADRAGRYENHFYPEPPFPFVSARMGNYHGSPFSDAGYAFRLAQAYDLISGSGALEALEAETGRDVRATIERDLLYEVARHTLETPFRATNYDGARIQGLGLLGRVLDEPEFVEKAYALYRTLIDNSFCYDGYWHEDTLNYFSMIVGGVLRVPDVLGGVGGMDVRGEMPFLPQIYTAPMGLFMPDGRTLMANDTWAVETLRNYRSNTIGSMGRFVEAADEMLGRARIPVADAEFALFRRSSEADRTCTPEDLLALVPENVLLPGAGNVILGIGRSSGAVRATLCYGPWGGHHHWDTLAMGLDAFGREVLSDIGYTHTPYRPWATSVASHNTVVVDGQEQTTAGGRLLGFRPASATRVGFVSAEAPEAFGNTSVYRRSLLLVPTGPDRGYVVDLFEVEGGEVHDYLLHGSADADQKVATDVPLADAEMGASGEGPGRAAYGYLRNVRGGDTETDTRVRFTGGGGGVDIRFAGVEGGRLLVGEGPSVRRAQEDDGRLEDFWYPVVCLRHSGGKSRFVSVIEAHPGDGVVREVAVVEGAESGLVVQVVEKGRVRTFGIDPDGDGVSARLPDGRTFELWGRVGVLTEGDGEVRMEVIDGSRMRVGNVAHEQARGYEGRLTGVVGDVSGEPGRSELEVDARLPSDGSMEGKAVYVTHPSGKETVYGIERVEAEGAGSRVVLEGMARFVWGRGEVARGEKGRFQSSVEQPKAAGYAGCRVRVGERTFTVQAMAGLGTFVLEGAFDFSTVEGERFEVFSTSAGDRFRIPI